MEVFLRTYSWELVLLVNYILVFITIFNILLNTINPIKALSYIVVLIVLPFIGLILYYFLGQQYRKNKIFKKKNILNQTNIKQWQQAGGHSEAELEQIGGNTLKKKMKLVRLLQKNQESPLTLYNQVELLVNAQAKFKRLLCDIEEAMHSIHLEYYILIDDEIGKTIIQALCRKAQQGVKVCFSYDYVGSRISAASRRKLKQSGVAFYPFMPVYFPKFTNKINYRNHRKIVVIDGKIGYLGGINIADRYLTPSWRDTHLRIEGEAVGSLQLQFMLNWDFVTPFDVLVEDHFFPKIVQTPVLPVQIVSSGPDTEWANIMEAIFTAINTAERCIYITTPYFIPNDEIITALTTAIKGGIEVKLIIPHNSDSWLTKYATFSYIEVLLQAGIRIYLYKKGFIHAKMIAIDDNLTILGTSNMDNRSFHLNFEINALIYDTETAKEARRLFEEDIQGSEEIFPNQWVSRKLSQKLKESFCRLWAPLL